MGGLAPLKNAKIEHIKHEGERVECYLTGGYRGWHYPNAKWRTNLET